MGNKELLLFENILLILEAPVTYYSKLDIERSPFIYYFFYNDMWKDNLDPFFVGSILI